MPRDRDLDEELFHPSRARDSIYTTREGLSRYTSSLSRTATLPRKEPRELHPQLTNFGLYRHIPWTIVMLLICGLICVIPDILLLAHRRYVHLWFAGGICTGILVVLACIVGFIARYRPRRNIVMAFAILNISVIVSAVILIAANVPNGGFEFAHPVRGLTSVKKRKHVHTLLLVTSVWCFITAIATMIVAAWNCFLCLKALWHDSADIGAPHLIELDRVVSSSDDGLRQQ